MYITAFAIKQYLRHQFFSRADNTGFVLPEVGILDGTSIMDVLYMNDTTNEIYGVEIKSERDTLSRLEHQIDSYSRVCRDVVLFLHSSHLKTLTYNEPLYNKARHCHIFTFSGDRASNFNYVQVQKPLEDNSHFKAEDCLTFLWKEELKALIDRYEVPIKKKLRKDALRKTIAQEIGDELVIYNVCNFVSNRMEWRRDDGVEKIAREGMPTMASMFPEGKK